ncbi:hypothetical protein NMY22_g11342 [Coprinellus aureogranulatus]|nr:hypothetical protein NMY22_g11342 [Coprinellus aureogranulatus]
MAQRCDATPLFLTIMSSLNNFTNSSGTPVLDSIFSRLPAEVLGEVFDQALEADICDPSLESVEQLIDICLVCREWQDVSRATPRLWQALTISCRLGPQTFENARKWFGRAKSLPKGLAVDTSNARHFDHCYKRYDCSLARRPFARFLTDGEISLHNLAITCPSSVCFYQLLPLLEERKTTGAVQGPGGLHPWDGIKSIQLDIFDDWNQWIDFQDPTQDIMTSLTYPIFHRLPPALTSLTLHLPSIPHDNEVAGYVALNIPEDKLSNVTNLTLTCDWYASKTLKVLEACNRVEQLTLDLNESFFARPTSSNGASAGKNDKARLLPSLKVLRIRKLDPQALEYLRYFRSPFLEELDLEFTEVGLYYQLHEPPFAMEVVVEFLLRSQCAQTLSRIWLRHAPLRDVRHLHRTHRLSFMNPPRFSVERNGGGIDGDLSDTWMISRSN